MLYHLFIGLKRIMKHLKRVHIECTDMKVVSILSANTLFTLTNQLLFRINVQMYSSCFHLYATIFFVNMPFFMKINMNENLLQVIFTMIEFLIQANVTSLHTFVYLISAAAPCLLFSAVYSQDEYFLFHGVTDGKCLE